MRSLTPPLAKGGCGNNASAHCRRQPQPRELKLNQIRTHPFFLCSAEVQLVAVFQQIAQPHRTHSLGSFSTCNATEPAS